MNKGNVVAILGCLLILALSQFLGLFRSVPLTDGDYLAKVFSHQNLTFNVLLFVYAAVVVSAGLFLRSLLRKWISSRKKKGEAE